MGEEWNELDAAAEANLPAHKLSEFHEYKKQLFEDGYSWADDAEDILTGYIWDESEGA